MNDANLKVATELVRRFFANQDVIIPTTRLEAAMTSAICEVLSKGPYVVGYWSQVDLITFDQNEAEDRERIKKAMYGALPYGARTIEQAIEHAYAAGLEDGRHEGDD